MIEYVKENERAIEVNGQRVSLLRKDPYGYWHVSLGKKPVPEPLRQAFTTLPLAESTILNYFQQVAQKG